MVNPEKISFGTINHRKNLGDLTELQFDLQQRHEQGKRAIVVPLLVRKLENDTNYDYELIDGKRRLQSALSVKLPEVAVVLEDEVSDHKELVAMSLKANEHRKDFHWTEEAIAFEDLLSKGLTQKELGKFLSKSQDYISERVVTYGKLKGTAYAVSLDLRTARHIARNCPQEDFEEVTGIVLGNKLSEKDALKTMINAKNVKHKLEQLEETNKELYDEIKEAYLSKKYTSNSSVLLQMEIDMRTGYAKAKDEYLQISRYTEKEAREYAKEHYGEFLGKTAIEVWRVYVVPLSFEEIRAKLEKL